VRGRINCDSYAGLRALLVPPSKRATAASRSRRRVALFGIEDAGRWSLVRQGAAASDGDAGDIEHAARALLRRYGVVAWRIVEREAAWLPSWRELARVYRRLEARGEIRGGRFIDALSGEQFALPEAISVMRRIRRQPHDGELICLAASDPANLLGTVLTGPKVARVPGSRVVYRDGVPLATSVAGQIEFLAPLETAEKRAVERMLTLSPSLRFLDQAAAPKAVERAA
jgi:ATP-dependent helicase Lhr and Lhr-like helicase